MQLYFAYISNSYTLTNGLAKAIYNLLRSYDRSIIPAASVDSFKQQVTADLLALNKQFPKCHPCEPKWGSGIRRHTQDFSLQLYGLNSNVCQFNLYASKPA